MTNKMTFYETIKIYKNLIPESVNVREQRRCKAAKKPGSANGREPETTGSCFPATYCRQAGTNPPALPGSRLSLAAVDAVHCDLNSLTDKKPDSLGDQVEFPSEQIPFSRGEFSQNKSLHRH